MTQENRIVFDLLDITAIRIACTNRECEGELLLSLDKDQSFPENQCPYCQNTWSGNGARLQELLYVKMTRALAHTNDRPVRLTFEVCGAPKNE